jgi:hypothetical protein
MSGGTAFHLTTCEIVDKATKLLKGRLPLGPEIGQYSNSAREYLKGKGVLTHSLTPFITLSYSSPPTTSLTSP